MNSFNSKPFHSTQTDVRTKIDPKDDKKPNVEYDDVDGNQHESVSVSHHVNQHNVEAQQQVTNNIKIPARKMPVSELQELCVGKGLAAPEYRLVAQEGFSHAPTFTIQVIISGVIKCEASSSTKKAAKHAAAAKALEELKRTNFNVPDISKTILLKEFEKLKISLQNSVQYSERQFDSAEKNLATERKTALEFYETLSDNKEIDSMFDMDGTDYCERINEIAEKLDCRCVYIDFSEDHSKSGKIKCLIQLMKLSATSMNVPVLTSWGYSQISLIEAKQRAAQKAIIMIKVLKM